MGGISTPFGFTIVGEVSTEDVAEAAIEALKRLRAGEEKPGDPFELWDEFCRARDCSRVIGMVGNFGVEKGYQEQIGAFTPGDDPGDNWLDPLQPIGTGCTKTYLNVRAPGWA